MKTLLVLLTTFSIPLFAEVNITVQGVNSQGDAASVYSCIAYQGCGVTTFSLGAENRLYIKTSKKEAEVFSDLKKCSIQKSKINYVKIKNELGETKSIKKNILYSAKNIIKPAILSLTFGGDYILKLERLVDEASSAQKVLGKVKSELGLSFEGYTVKIGKQSDYAVTDHKTKEIEFPNLKELDVFEAIRVLRHEADHVLQQKINLNCKGKSQFTDHSIRERAAYLNDAGFGELTEYGGELFLLDIQRYKFYKKK